MAQVKETKDFYQKHTKHVFEFMLKCASDGIQTEKETYQFHFFSADLSCHWKVLGTGGACKVVRNFLSSVWLPFRKLCKKQGRFLQM